MVEAAQTRAWMVERPLNDRNAVLNGGVQEILRFEPGMVELRVEPKNPYDIGLEAFAQFQTLPADTKGDGFGFDPDAIQIFADVFGKDPIVRMIGVTNIKHARIDAGRHCDSWNSPRF